MNNFYTSDFLGLCLFWPLLYFSVALCWNILRNLQFSEATTYILFCKSYMVFECVAQSNIQYKLFQCLHFLGSIEKSYNLELTRCGGIILYFLESVIITLTGLYHCHFNNFLWIPQKICISMPYQFIL